MPLTVGTCGPTERDGATRLREWSQLGSHFSSKKAKLWLRGNMFTDRTEAGE